jgi:hypothetical protein
MKTEPRLLSNGEARASSNIYVVVLGMEAKLHFMGLQLLSALAMRKPTRQ